MDSEPFMTTHEKWWCSLQPFLESRGYMLRPRYRPGWIPSWSDEKDSIKRFSYGYEDSVMNRRTNIIDATRMSDCQKVAIKASSSQCDEWSIAEYLSSPELQKDPHNHSVPVLEVFTMPDDESRVFIVMPMLLLAHTPAFHCIPECIDAMRQLLQSLEFMHRYNIAHRDACTHNMMMDPTNVVPEGFHFGRYWTSDGHHKWSPKHRCQVAPVHYYFIDFEFSMWFADPEKAEVAGLWGQIKTIPEMQTPEPYNPFKADVYQLGASFIDIFKKYKGVDVFTPFLQRMTCPNPADRPTAAEALADFEVFVNGMDPKSIRRRVWSTATTCGNSPPGKPAQLLCRMFPSLIPYL